MNHEQADYLQHYGVLGMKWGQRRARINAVKSNKARAKGNTEKANKLSAKSKRIEAKHRDRAGNKAYNRVKKTKTGKLVAQSMLMGTYGTLNYHRMRAKGNKMGKSAVAGILSGVGNAHTGGLLSVVEPRVGQNNRKALASEAKGYAKSAKKAIKKRADK